VVVMPKFNHTCCWANVWPKILRDLPPAHTITTTTVGQHSNARPCVAQDHLLRHLSAARAASGPAIQGNVTGIAERCGAAPIGSQIGFAVHSHEHRAG